MTRKWYFNEVMPWYSLLGNFYLKSESMNYDIRSLSMEKGRNILSFHGSPGTHAALGRVRWGCAGCFCLFPSLPAARRTASPCWSAATHWPPAWDICRGCCMFPRDLSAVCLGGGSAPGEGLASQSWRQDVPTHVQPQACLRSET